MFEYDFISGIQNVLRMGGTLLLFRNKSGIFRLWRIYTNLSAEGFLLSWNYWMAKNKLRTLKKVYDLFELVYYYYYYFLALLFKDYRISRQFLFFKSFDQYTSLLYFDIRFNIKILFFFIYIFTLFLQ